jgi:hypothetical protein
MLKKSDVFGSIHSYKIDYKSEPQLANRKEFEEASDDLRTADISVRQQRSGLVTLVIRLQHALASLKGMVVSVD